MCAVQKAGVRSRRRPVLAVSAAVGCAAFLGVSCLAWSADFPLGSTAGHVVVDDASGEVESQDNEHLKFRAASVVKLLIALDHLERLDPDVPITEDDRLLLQPMLRSSNDDVATALWAEGGGVEIIERAVDKIGLSDTEPPPAGQETTWGYTRMSASDVAATYRYIRHGADPRTRDFMLENLRRHTACAADGFDQSFGLPSAAPEVGAVKQGWSGFGASPASGRRCNGSDDPARTGELLADLAGQAVRAPAPVDDVPAAADDVPAAAEQAADPNTTRRAMHTTGIVDDKIVVLLTLQPDGTTWQTAADAVSERTGELLQS
uniref:hypothetical protein n=1 Tax=Saccharopolyspora galaxeae TaxID=2781241 RepID=UPI001F1DE3A8|nr:hypothetical protein [Saccharopolyspora sp. HNM0986]